MRYNTFRNIAIAVVVVAAAGVAASVVIMRPQAAPEPPPATPTPPPAAPTTPQPVAAVATGAATGGATTGATGGSLASAPGLRPVDVDVLALLQRPVTDKIKDGTKGKPYKVNVYSDDGKAWNRAKVDLNRNEKWDESWTFKDGGVERKVAPKDDESYSEAWRLDAKSGWVKAGS